MNRPLALNYLRADAGRDIPIRLRNSAVVIRVARGGGSGREGKKEKEMELRGEKMTLMDF